MKQIICLGIGLIIYAMTIPAQARPVSYPGGWTIMSMNDGDRHSLHYHYSPAPNYSVGYRTQYNRGDEYWLNALQTNILLKRWNGSGSQANLYLKSGTGIASKRQGENEDALAIFSGIAADWETRRWFVSYENHGLSAGKIDSHYQQHARVGVAPYIGDYGDLHTWFMVQFDHHPGDEDSFVITPLVRFFKDEALLEAGLSSENDILFNFVYRF